MASIRKLVGALVIIRIAALDRLGLQLISLLHDVSGDLRGGFCGTVFLQDIFTGAVVRVRLRSKSGGARIRAARRKLRVRFIRSLSIG